MRQEAIDSAVSSDGSGGLGKVTPPSLNRVHANERLFARLDAGFARPVIWVQGQPGAGKTTLVASYLAARRIAPLWYRLDEGDADPATLFFYLAEAAGRTRGRDAPQLQRLTPEHRPGTALFARRFFRDLFEGGTSVVVFDDYHELGPAAALHDFLPQALEETPAGRHVVIVSRGGPPSQLARLRLNGMIDFVGGEALRMSVEEAAGLARERGAPADAESIGRLVGRTHGWAAGLVLMLESASGEDMPAMPVGEAASDVLFDYFAGEVLARMEPRVRRLLAAVAMMPDVTAESAVALTGEADAAAALEDLRRRNYFTTRDVQAEPRYRFHPMFRDVLLAETRRIFPIAELASLKLRAAAILDDAGQPEPAALLLAEAGAFDELAALVKRRAKSLVEGGRQQTLSAWLERLPDQSVAGDGWLSYWRGAALLYFRPNEARPHLSRAGELFKAADDATGEFLAWVDLAETVRVDNLGSMARYDDSIAAMAELQSRRPEFPSPQVAARVAYGMATALFRRSGDRAATALWRRRAEAAMQAVPNRDACLTPAFMFAVSDLNDGNFVAARALLEALPDPLTLDHLPEAQATGLIAHSLAFMYGQREGDFGAFVDEALRRLEAGGFVTMLPLVAGFAATGAVLRGDGTAGEWLRRTAAYADRVAPNRGAHYHLTKSRQCLVDRDLADARQHADDALRIAEEVGWYLYEAGARRGRAEVRVETGELDGAEEDLAHVDRIMARSTCASVAFEAVLLKADLCYARGDREGGASQLAEAMAIGRARDARSALLTSARLSRLCGEALQLGIEPEFVEGFIRHAQLRPPDADQELWPWPLAIRTLGHLDISQNGRPLAVSRKAPKRLIALIKAIAAHGGTDVAETQVVDAVWPDEEGDAGRQSFKVAVHRLRQLLGDAGALVVKGGRVTLDPARCWLDVRAFEHLTAPRAADERAEAFDARQMRALALYRADFLAGEDDAYWAAPKRARLRARFVRAVCDAAERRAVCGDCEDAAALYRKAMEIAPDSEEICQALMRRCLATGRSAEGRSAYERLRAALEDGSGAAPAAATDALHRKLAAL